MIPSYLFTHVHVVCLFLIVIAVYCFNEPCVDDTSCAPAGLQCYGRHCRCPEDQFWAGSRQKCILCPTGWINLYVFCLYYERVSATWPNANDACRTMSGFVAASTRLLVLNNLDEFDFIANVIPAILTADQMEVEHTHGQHSLSSIAAFIGSQGRKNSKGKWVYQWSDQPDKVFANDSPMWCKGGQWHSVTIPGEPAWEQTTSIETTDQALKQWSESGQACLASFRREKKLPFLCEIVGDPDRLVNQSTTVASTTTRRSTLSSSSRPSTISNSSTIHIILPSITTPPSLSTSTATLNWTSPITSVTMKLTTVQSDLQRKRLLFIVLGTIGVLVLVALCVLVIYVQNSRKESSSDGKSRAKSSLFHTRMNAADADDGQTNDSFESRVTKESATEESARVISDTQSLAPSTQSSMQASKLALWDQMELSLFTTTLTVPSKR